MDPVMFWLALVAAAGSVGAVIAGVAACAYARRAEKRATEPRDIVWRTQRTGDGFAFSHDSLTPASEVMIVVTVNGEASVGKAEAVPRGVEMPVLNDGHAALVKSAEEETAEYERELREREKRKERQSSSWMTVPSIASFPVIPPMSSNAEVNAIIVWRYPSGAPGRQELSWTETY